uniref:GLOBIN domain-containing protein n=1 Tax=Steinernema glaseri TaxID=37863 RepID=A0A1I8A2G3_9BILA
MDGLPLDFHERLCATVHRDTLPAMTELSGYYAEVARTWYRHLSAYVTSVKDGIQKGGYLNYKFFQHRAHTHEEIAAVPKKFVWAVMVNLHDKKNENVSREIVKRFPYAEYQFALHSPSINESWVDFASSLKRLSCIHIMKKFDDDAIRLFQKIIDSRKLSRLPICQEACKGGM